MRKHTPGIALYLHTIGHFGFPPRRRESTMKLIMARMVASVAGWQPVIRLPRPQWPLWVLMEELAANIEAWGISLGKALAPALRQVIVAFQPLLDEIESTEDS